MNPEYNLSICAVNGDIYGFISDDKPRLWKFLREYDHEGSTISLVRKNGPEFTEVDYDEIYDELEPGKEDE